LNLDKLERYGVDERKEASAELVSLACAGAPADVDILEVLRERRAASWLKPLAWSGP
jgi:hypothetical protein